MTRKLLKFSGIDGAAPRVFQKASDLPVYRQVADLLERDIRRRPSKRERTPLPSENELASEFKISRVTVRQALGELHRNGLIYRERGRGSYACSQHVGGTSGFGSSTAEVEKAGCKPSSRVLEFVKGSSLPEDMTRHLANAPARANQYHRLTRLRYVDTQPVALEETCLNVDTYTGIEKAQVEKGSLYPAMMRHRALRSMAL